MKLDEIRKRIEDALPGSRAEVQDLGGGDHLAVSVVSELFRGKSRVQQHQMINALFKQEMATDEVHALALKTYTPEDAPGGNS